MTIQPYLHYKESEVLPLYRAVGWIAYVRHPDMLEQAFANSLCILATFENEKLVGLIRCVGDGHSVVFVQDLLVDPEYQRKGIGTALMRTVLERYAHVYQIQLATDNTEKTIAFYRSLGFRPMDELGCCAFMKNGKL